MLTQTIIENVLILAAESFWLSSTLSQLIKLARTRDIKGLFAPTLVLNAAGNFAWVAYFSSLGLIVPVCTNVAMAALTITTVGFLLANRKQFVKALASILVIAPIVTILIISYADFSGWIGVIFNTISATPWLYHVVTTKKTSGISKKSLYFSLSAIACNLVYSLMIGSAPVFVGSLRGFVYTSVILRYYFKFGQASKHR